MIWLSWLWTVPAVIGLFVSVYMDYITHRERRITRKLELNGLREIANTSSFRVGGLLSIALACMAVVGIMGILRINNQWVGIGAFMVLDFSIVGVRLLEFYTRIRLINYADEVEE